MSLIALGINHKTAPVKIREQLSFAPDIIPDALRDLTSQDAVNEAVILSTCNRTELYCQLNCDDDGSQDATDALIYWLQEHHGLLDTDISEYLYLHPDKDAVKHMLRVASGLDSLVLGEPQILGQLKSAFSVAKESNAIGQFLHKLFQHTFSCAKQVRTDTAIGASPVSVAFASVSLAKQIFSDFQHHTALLIGAGETIELVARHLHESGIGRIIIANRTVEKAHTLAQEFDGYAISLSEIPTHLAEADIVISSTASQLPILGKGTVEAAIKARKHRPIFMVDIAVPRDIEEQVGDLEDIFLYTVDDLKEIIDEGLKSRQEAALKAEEIIDGEVSHFMNWLRSLNSISTMCQYREKSEAIRDEVLSNAKKQLENGKPVEQVLNDVARQLTNKLIHKPCVQIKQAGMDGRTDLVDAAIELFDLQADDQ
ncbi:MAG: glutamyl-tRNA reductase [gamma proteobacterium symbiont of Lucinoma myriamae]|nr:glutamyl-tRNA reductase [gamma proteobacterium symbiont of Lucinoma myriamae]MCU7819120.1 glutamyl-tRNA reductase [gamma proteobacterium symbiont of Lucinoma myriamae]MCU7831452.1 glutamyl-tRNA reductase [gamma proteobacterium symbiont of Lucinoma myriamae]